MSVIRTINGECNMILIADSGSTKCDWLVIDGLNSFEYQTVGFNPMFHTSEWMEGQVRNNEGLISKSSGISEIYYYGASCSEPERKQRVSQALQSVFSNAKVTVEHDLLGAVRATCLGEPGFTCILGTGSNCAFFDGNEIQRGLPALGFLLGDEGGGAYFGKLLLRDYLYQKVPQAINRELAENYGLDKEFIFGKVYRESGANVFLASYAKVLSKYKQEPYTIELIKNGFKEFLQTQVCYFDHYAKFPVHFVGSIAYHFSDLLTESASELGITIGRIVSKPLANLAVYHQHNRN